MSLRTEGTMEVNVSVCTDGPRQQVSVEKSPGSDNRLAKETSFQWVSTTHKGTESFAPPSMLMNGLYSGSNELDDGPPRPRPRYKRRNSAVASMLLPIMVKASTVHATQFRSSARSPETFPPLLSAGAANPPLDPVEAINKAQELLQEKSESPPPLEPVRAKKRMFKRASVPWCQTYPEPTVVQSDVVERSHTRQRHG